MRDPSLSIMIHIIPCAPFSVIICCASNRSIKNSTFHYCNRCLTSNFSLNYQHRFPYPYQLHHQGPLLYYTSPPQTSVSPSTPLLIMYPLVWILSDILYPLTLLLKLIYYFLPPYLINVMCLCVLFNIRIHQLPSFLLKP